MKRIYLLSLWLLACLVLPMKGQAVAQADLLNSERFEHIDSSADSGRGDGKYLDLSSVKPVSAPNGHRRIEAVIYVSMPAANMIQGLSVQYDYQMDRSLRHLINAHDQALKQGNRYRKSLFGVPNKGTQESLELLMMAVPIIMMDRFVNNVYIKKI